MREVDVFVVLADVLSCGTEVQEVNKQLPTKTRRAEIRNFFIGYALGVETLRASKKLQALNPRAPGRSPAVLLCVVLRDARGCVGLVLRNACGRIGCASPTGSF